MGSLFFFAPVYNGAMKRYLRITLSGGYRESPPRSAPIPSTPSSAKSRLDQLILLVNRAVDSRKIRKVLIDCRRDFSPGLFGGPEEIRRQLERLARAGKECWFYSPEYNGLALYLASACEHRAIHPLGTLSYLGLARPFLFFKGVLDKQKIEPVVFRRGVYKSAADAFRSDSLEERNREQQARYLELVSGELERAVGEGFGKPPEALEDLKKGTMLTAQAACEEGWIDSAETVGSIIARWEGEEKLKRDSPGRLKRHYGSGRRKLAVLFLEGAIIDGESRNHPLFGEALGEATAVPLIERIAREKSIKGVVVRVNSPGGSATASEEILASLRRLAEKKPVVVSMSAVAGSGGYWISLAGERIFAQETTLTGSIGVISLSFYLRKFLKRLGVSAETIRTAAHADLGSGLREMTKKERALLDAIVEELYDQFLKSVSAARGVSQDEVDRLGRGRIWAGEDAREGGLVDEIGGLQEAIDYLAAKLTLKRHRVLFYPEEKRSLLQRLLLKGSPLSLLPAAAASRLPAGPAPLLSSLLSDSGAPMLYTPEALELTSLVEVAAMLTGRGDR